VLPQVPHATSIMITMHDMDGMHQLRRASPNLAATFATKSRVLVQCDESGHMRQVSRVIGYVLAIGQRVFVGCAMPGDGSDAC
jgi:hypothetical protein